MRPIESSGEAPAGAARLFMLLILLGAAPVLAGGDIPAEPPESARIEWASGLDEALKRASASHRPVLVALVSDSRLPTASAPGGGEPPGAAYRDPIVIRAAERFVCLAASPDRHELREGTCSCFGGLRCPAHRAVAEQIRDRYLAGAEPEWPEHWILDTDGRLLSRFRGAVTPVELAESLHRAADRFEGAAARAITGALAARRAADRASGFRLALSFLNAHPTHSVVRGASARYLKRIKRTAERHAAWRQVEEAGTEAALALLAPWLEAKSPQLRARTLAVFGEAPPYRTHLPALAARARRERVDATLVPLVRALANHTSVDARAYDALNRLVGHRSDAVRVAATLAAAAPENRGIRGELVRRAQREANPRARAAAILGLARMADVDALPVLRRVARKERRGTVGDAVDLAIRCLEGDAGAARALDEAVDRLRAESGGGAAAEARDRTDRKWRDMGRGR